jgi:HK97 family phage prohead protease
MLTKTIKNAEFKIGNIGNDLIVEAYASIFGNVDAGRDRMQKGAFTKTLNENSKRIKTLFNHDWNQIIGKPLEMIEDSKGLYTKTRFVNTAKSLEIYELVKENIVNELSIGYDVIKNSYDREQKINNLQEVKLYEYSFVTFAMNQEAQVIDVKSLEKLFIEIKAGRVLSDKNVNNIKKIIDSLNALLEESGNQEEPENGKVIDPTTRETAGCKPKKSLEIDTNELLIQLKKLRNKN